MKLLKSFITILCVAVFAGPIGCSARKSIPVGEVPVAPQPSAEKRANSLSLAQQYAAAGGYEVIKSSPQQKRLQNMVDRLTKATGAKGFTYPVTLVEAGDEVNAAAIDGASIVVHTSLLKKLRNDNEVAVVLGHEVAHIAAKHHNDDGEKSRATAVTVGSGVLGTAAAAGAAYAGLGSGGAQMAGRATAGAAAVVGTGAFVKAYSRDMEREADQVGLMIMAKAGYDPKAALDVWARSAEIFGGAGGPQFFSTHPSGKDRLKRLEEAMPVALSYYKPGSAPASPEDADKPKAKGKKTAKAKKKQ